jgi:hypothetical protein
MNHKSDSIKNRRRNGIERSCNIRLNMVNNNTCFPECSSVHASIEIWPCQVMRLSMHSGLRAVRGRLTWWLKVVREQSMWIYWLMSKWILGSRRSCTCSLIPVYLLIAVVVNNRHSTPPPEDLRVADRNVHNSLNDDIADRFGVRTLTVRS